MNNALEHLDSSYRAKSIAENAHVYNNWASTFEQEMGAMGYVNPALTPAIVERWAPSKDVKILDIGCATGLVGGYLHFLGFTNLHAVDHSSEMVEFAKQKNVYQAVKNESLTPNKQLSYTDNEFDITIPMGIFTVSHAPVEGVEEVLRITKSGGFIVFSCTQPGWNSGFGAKFEELSLTNKWIQVDKTKEYITIPGAAKDRLYKSVIYVYQKL